MRQSLATIVWEASPTAWEASPTAIKPSFRAVLANLNVSGRRDSRTQRNRGGAKRKRDGFANTAAGPSSAGRTRLLGWRLNGVLGSHTTGRLRLTATCLKRLPSGLQGKRAPNSKAGHAAEQFCCGSFFGTHPRRGVHPMQRVRRLCTPGRETFCPEHQIVCTARGFAPLPPRNLAETVQTTQRSEYFPTATWSS